MESVERFVTKAFCSAYYKDGHAHSPDVEFHKDQFSALINSFNSHSFLPNQMETVERFVTKAFCGTYSKDGNVFLSACQDQYLRLYDVTKGRFKKFREIRARDVGWSIVDTAFR